MCAVSEFPALDHMLVATVVMVSGSAFGRSVAWSFLSGRLRSSQRRMPEPQRQAGPVMGRDPHTGISPHADSVCAAIGRAYAAARWFLDEDGQAFLPSPSSILESSTSSGLFFSPAPRMPRRIPGAALGLESGHVVHVQSSEGWAFFGPTCCALTSGSPRGVAGALFFRAEGSSLAALADVPLVVRCATGTCLSSGKGGGAGSWTASPVMRCKKQQRHAPLDANESDALPGHAGCALRCLWPGCILGHRSCLVERCGHTGLE